MQIKMFQTTLIRCAITLAIALASGANPGITAEQGDAKDPCLGLGVEDAARLLGVGEPEIKITRGSEMMPDLCVFASNADWLKRLSFSTYRFSDEKEAVQEFVKLREGFAFLSEIVPLPNLGAEAFSAPGDRLKRLVVRKGGVLIDVMPADSIERQKTTAEYLLQRVP